MPANTNQALAIIRLKKQEYVNYISYYLQSKIKKNMINGSKSIGAQPNLSLAKISNIKVKLPTNDDLRNIKLLKLIDNKITTQKKIIESKKSLIKSISQYYFKNKITNIELKDAVLINKGKQINGSLFNDTFNYLFF